VPVTGRAWCYRPPTANNNGPLIGGLVVSALGVAGLGAAIWGIVQIQNDADGVEIRAEVLEAKAVPFKFTGQRAGGGTYEADGTRVQVRYAFEVDGKRYESSRYSLDDEFDDYKGSSDQAEAQQRIASLRSGKVTAWYDPQDPARVVLARANRVAPYAVGVVALVLLAIGALQLMRWRALARGQE
jgi:hypothetical protein